jgi:hypothetical protein
MVTEVVLNSLLTTPIMSQCRFPKRAIQESEANLIESVVRPRFHDLQNIYLSLSHIDFVRKCQIELVTKDNIRKKVYDVRHSVAH